MEELLLSGSMFISYND